MIVSYGGESNNLMFGGLEDLDEVTLKEISPVNANIRNIPDDLTI